MAHTLQLDRPAMDGSALFLMSIPVLLVGAGLAAGLRDNRARGVAALVTQAIATLLVLISIWPILAGGSSIEVTWPWPAPIERIAFRLDALGAFFLAWSLPMTLLGTLYALGYLRPYFNAGRNGGPHFALLNMTLKDFCLARTPCIYYTDGNNLRSGSATWLSHERLWPNCR